MSAEEYKRRREEFRSRCPKATIGEVNITGLNEHQQRIAERMMKIGSRGDEVMHAQEFSENYLSTLANGIARSEFPTFTYNYDTKRYDVHLPLSVRPMFDIAIGGNISSTAFNQAYIGLNYNKIGRVGQSFHLDMLLGPVYTMARLWGRTTFILDKPLYVDYAFNFNIHNTLNGNFGNLSRVDNSEPIRMMENFIALAAGSAFERKSVVELRLNMGSNSYRYSMDMYEKRQYTHFDYITPAIVLERSTFDKPLFPTRGSHMVASAMYAYGRDRRTSQQESMMSVGENIDMIRQWWGVKAHWEQYLGIDARGVFTVGYAVEGVYTTHPEFDSREATMLSSPQYAPLIHSRMIYMPEFRADRYLGVGLMPTVRLYDNLYARLSLYAMLRDKFAGDVMHYMSDLSLIYHTPIGPVSLALTKYNLHNGNNLYLTFNFGYAIFGRKGLHY
jgi:NTE family protein